MITSTQSSPSQSAISETLSAKPLGISDTQSSQLAGIGALSEREALQTKLDSGRPLTPVEQGTLERLSAADQANGVRAGLEIYLAQQIQNQNSTNSGPTGVTNVEADSNFVMDMLQGIGSALFPDTRQPKTVEDFNLVNATPQDITDFKAALEYLQGTNSDGSWKSETAVDLLSEIPEGTTIVFNHFGMTAANPDTGAIAWDPRAALLLDNGYQSPALGLVHEIDHALNYQEPVPTGDGYGNTEERRVISGTETQIAKDLGEITRTDHDGNPYGVRSSTQHSNSD